MTYFQGFIVPVPEGNRNAYTKHAHDFAAALRECGVQRQLEAWGADLPEGKLTDFRKSVDATPGETAVFAWFEFPDRKTRDAANEAMMNSSEMEEMSKDVPFDAKRMIYGGFDAVVEEGKPGGTFVDGIVVPVPENKREEYARLAGKNAKVFIEFGATRVIETLGDDVPHGKVTDFYRAVKAEDGETIAFSFIEWPDKAARDEAWQKIMQDERMQHGGGLFDGKRMFWGGFEVVIDTASQQEASIAASPVTA
ncbi:MAG TPA: DUF1428 domain-containing protein [Sphingomicrobium sp.]|jgi:uncharacterized protein YbaA (DUF1428 family)